MSQSQKTMPDEITQPTTPPEPVQTPTEPQSAPIIDPVAIQSPIESMPASTATSETPTMPPVATEGPISPVVSGSNISAPPVLEPQNQLPAPVSAPVEPAPTPIPAVQAVASATAPNPRSLLAKALEKIQFRKRAKLEKIMKFAQGRKEITNDQVEKLLHISDSTAQRYLIQLAKEGKLKRIGKDGSSLYEPLNGSNPTN